MSTVDTKSMKYVRLGNSGLKISKIILGLMSYGSSDWAPWALSEEEGLKHIKNAYDAGIQTFDTADVFSNGQSEIILGKAVKKYNLPRDEIVVLTKLWGTVGKTAGEWYFGKPGEQNPEELGYVNQRGLSRKHIFGGVKASLERLGLDYIDVLQCHRFDPDTPIQETMQALHDVVKAGYVRYIGMSSCYAWQFHIMQNYAINNRLTPFISMQNHYNLVYREEEREMMPMLKHFGVGSIPWSPLGRGALARPLDQTSSTKRAESDTYHSQYLGEGTGGVEILKRLQELANKKQRSMAQVALAWIMNKEPVAAPTVGVTTLEHLNDLLGAIDLQLSEDEMQHIEEPYKPLAIIGH